LTAALGYPVAAKGETTMKTLFAPFTAILVILLLGITGCASQAAQPTPPPPTPTPLPEPTTEAAPTIVQNMVDRMNAGDVEGSLAYFADDAVAYIIGLPPTGMEVYAGKKQIRTLWQDSVDNHFQWEVNITSADGDIVYVKAKTWHDFTRQLGVAPLEYNDVYEVRDGKIATYGTTITADALARFMPAFEEVVPPEEPAAPSTEKPVSEMTVTIAGGTCALDSPAPLQAGEIKVTLNVKDQNKDLYALTIFNLDADKDLLDLMASTAGMPPSWADMLLFQELGPGKSETYTFNVEKGPVYLICWSKPPDLPIGNAGPIEVQGSP
jgi:ketosteroid isomerase-like protein